MTELTRCELCGEPTEHSLWPGRMSIWHVCSECVLKLVKAIGGRGTGSTGWELPGWTAGFWPPKEWWTTPDRSGTIHALIDSAAEDLRSKLRAHGSAVLHGVHEVGDLEDYRVVSHKTVDKGCAVCGHSKADPHTFISKAGRVVVNLCCPGCCHDVTQDWRKREPDFAATTMNGVMFSIDACAARVRERHEQMAQADMNIARTFAREQAERQRDHNNREREQQATSQAVAAMAEAQQGAVDGLLQLLQRVAGKQVNTPILPHAHSSLLAHELSGKQPCGSWMPKYKGYDYKATAGSKVRADVAGTVEAVCPASSEPKKRSCPDCGTRCNSRGVTLAPATNCQHWTQAPYARGDLVRPTKDALVAHHLMGELKVEGSNQPLWPARVTDIFTRYDSAPEWATYVRVLGGGGCWLADKLERVLFQQPSPGTCDAVIAGQMVEHKTSGPPTPETWKPDLPTAAPESAKEPASEKSPPPTPTKNPGRCSRCHAVVHAAAPSRDGNWYCESCVRSATALYETLKCTEAKEAREEAEKLNPPPPPPMPGGRRPYGLLGDLHGPKV